MFGFGFNKYKIADCIQVSASLAKQVEKEEERLYCLSYSDVLECVNNDYTEIHPLTITNTVINLKNNFLAEFIRNKYLYNILVDHFKKKKCRALINLLIETNSDTCLETTTQTITVGRLIWEMRNQFPDFIEYRAENISTVHTSPFKGDFMYDHMHGLYLFQSAISDGIANIHETFNLVRNNWEHLSVKQLPFSHQDCETLDKSFVDLVYLADMDCCSTGQEKPYHDNPTQMDYKKLKYVVLNQSTVDLFESTTVQSYFKLNDTSAKLKKMITESEKPFSGENQTQLRPTSIASDVQT
jgi:hypothetical protein